MQQNIVLIKVKDNFLIKQASINPESLQQARDIMDIIYKESPQYWPYGLNVEGHDEVYLVRDNLTKKACGFVGWQEVNENGKLVGSYSIGILPEYRCNGLAKEAVAKLLQKKASKVDIVKAFIKKENSNSINLAKSLHIPIEQEF